MSAEGEAVPAEPAPAPEPQAPPPGMGVHEQQITAVKEQVVVKKTTPKPAPEPEPEPPQDTRPRKPKSQPSPAKTQPSPAKVSEYSATKSIRSSSREHGDYLGVAALSREFRGTSPSVLENIASHPLLFGPNYEPLKRPHLSARSRKVFRDAADLAVIAPGLRNLYEFNKLCSHSS